MVLETLERTDKQDEPLLGQSLSQLTEWVEAQGQPTYRGKQLYQWIYEERGSFIR